ncbi:BLUF domain-containing protein [Xanthomonas maliensis]|uniref:BLUF domain-containing protein n=1 Tax=Xanthomonas maliensis TaxID=1321368 RepID=UPI0003A639E7|nr:BLUF domain-containing protein [Xanthomonas maliensis]KAB7766501.1 hypothetical protein CKY51_13200 [Xanthomonas maliensis]
MPTHQPLHALAYISVPRRPFSIAELDELVVRASARNALLQVTGVLLHDGQTFFQYLEGPRDGVDEVYARVQRATRHRIQAEVFREPVASRYFGHWHMAGRKAEPGTILSLGSAPWQRAQVQLPMPDSQPPGLRALLAFWEHTAD